MDIVIEGKSGHLYLAACLRETSYLLVGRVLPRLTFAAFFAEGAGRVSLLLVLQVVGRKMSIVRYSLNSMEVVVVHICMH